MIKYFFVVIAWLLFCIAILPAQDEYKNDIYGFSFSIPEDWTVYAERRHDPQNNKSIVSFGLPKVFSELEQTAIENAVAITAYKNDKITSLEDLLEFENNRTNHMDITKEFVSSDFDTSFVSLSQIRGLTYKSKSILHYINGVAYVISFTATPGTYDINIPIFEEFVKTIKFFQPKEYKGKIVNSNIKKNGVYYAYIKDSEFGFKNNYAFVLLKFEEDSTVYIYHPESSHFPKVDEIIQEGKYNRIGKYSINGQSIEFEVTNLGLEINNSEGKKEETYSGYILLSKRLHLRLKYDGDKTEQRWFEFIPFESDDTNKQGKTK